MTHFLTRAVLDKGAPEQALLPLLDPLDEGRALDAHHRLIWTLFPDRNAKRDFLWRADGKGRFFILSAREPQHSRLFKPLQSKPFELALAAGERLAFVLRANATRDRRPAPHDNDQETRDPTGRLRRDRRVDIVMHSMRERGLQGGLTGAGSRAAGRMDIADQVARVWLTGQGEHRGFAVDEMAVEDYRVRKVKRKGGKEATFGVLDMRGLLTVQHPDAFTRALLIGFGRAKAYGCGLMLVRRA